MRLSPLRAGRSCSSRRNIGQRVVRAPPVTVRLRTEPWKGHAAGCRHDGRSLRRLPMRCGDGDRATRSDRLVSLDAAISRDASRTRIDVGGDLLCDLLVRLLAGRQTHRTRPPNLHAVTVMPETLSVLLVAVTSMVAVKTRPTVPPSLYGRGIGPSWFPIADVVQVEAAVAVPVAIGRQQREVLLAGIFDRIVHRRGVQDVSFPRIDLPRLGQRLAQRRRVVGLRTVQLRVPGVLLRRLKLEMFRKEGRRCC